jgi:dTDP-glucose pyrophosphorylase
MKLLEPKIQGNVLVTNGDDLYHPQDLADTLTTYGTGGAVIGMEVKNAEQYGLLEVDEAGCLKAITERPHHHSQGVINTGTYVITPEFFRFPLVPISETEYGLPQTLALVAEEHGVVVTRARAWQSVGCPEDIPLAEDFITKYLL